MRRSFQVLAIMTLTAGTSVAAQNPPPPAAGRGLPGAVAGERSAQMLLSRSAELDLTDAQVTKLAQIARRSEARRRTMRSAMDSARARFTQPGDSTARRQFAQRMQNDMTKERDQARVDLRDAITVLTPDQQAKAWEMNAARGARGMRGGRGGGMRAPGGMRPGRGGAPGGRARGFGPDGRVPDEMPPMRQMRPGRAPGAGGAMPRRPRPEFDDVSNAAKPE